MRTRWVAVVLVPVLAIFAACLTNAVLRVHRPFPGFLVLENGIIVSIGRVEWANARYRSLPFARVLAVDGHPAAGGRDVDAYVSRTRIGKPVTYTLRRGTTIFRLAVRVRPLGWDDFLELFAPFLGVGLLMVVVSGTVVAIRPDAGETRALFAVCLAIALILITAPDAYSPYWFTPLAFLSMCAVPPAALQLALSWPQPRALLLRRPALYGLAYVPFAGLAAALLWSRREPSLFLPLLYLVYVFMANGVLLNVGALVFGLIDGVEPRRPVVLALAGVLGSSLIAASIVATYPLLQRPISPGWAFGPLLLLPLLEGIAFLRFPAPAVPTR